jgi:hypothetical protein
MFYKGFDKPVTSILWVEDGGTNSKVLVSVYTTTQYTIPHDHGLDYLPMSEAQISLI